MRLIDILHALLTSFFLLFSSTSCLSHRPWTQLSQSLLQCASLLLILSLPLDCLTSHLAQHSVGTVRLFQSSHLHDCNWCVYLFYTPDKISYHLICNKAILYFEFILTFPLEVERFWGRPSGWASTLFYINRYTSFIFHLPVLYKYFWSQSESVWLSQSSVASLQLICFWQRYTIYDHYRMNKKNPKMTIAPVQL